MVLFGMIIASKGGSDAPPAWYLNLSQNPAVEVQVKGDRFKAHARTASAAEKPEMWKRMLAKWPNTRPTSETRSARSRS